MQDDDKWGRGGVLMNFWVPLNALKFLTSRANFGCSRELILVQVVNFM